MSSNPSVRARRRGPLALLTALVLASGSTLLVGVGAASAESDVVAAGAQVWVCHATTSDANPYAAVQVDVGSPVLKGHLRHRTDPGRQWKTGHWWNHTWYDAGSPKRDFVEGLDDGVSEAFCQAPALLTEPDPTPPPTDDGGDAVWVCHATASDNDPYEAVRVDPTSGAYRTHLRHRDAPERTWRHDRSWNGEVHAAGSPKRDYVQDLDPGVTQAYCTAPASAVAPSEPVETTQVWVCHATGSDDIPFEALHLDTADLEFKGHLAHHGDAKALRSWQDYRWWHGHLYAPGDPKGDLIEGMDAGVGRAYCLTPALIRTNVKPVWSEATCADGGVAGWTTRGRHVTWDRESGTATPGDTVEVTATAESDHALRGGLPTQTWAHTFDAFDPATCVVVPEPATFVDPTCDAPGTAGLTLPTVDGVTYAVTGEQVAGGTVEITATPGDGYRVADGAATRWTHVFELPVDCTEVLPPDSPETTLVPTPPSFVDPTCDAPGTAGLTLPTVDGVTYAVTGEQVAGGTVEITATPGDGYRVADGAATRWTHVFELPVDCTEVLPPDSPETTLVPTPPSFVDPSCAAPEAAGVTLPEGDGVTYAMTGEQVPGGTVEITATAEDGFEIGDGAVAGWTHLFELPVDCNEVLPPVTEPPTAVDPPSQVSPPTVVHSPTQVSPPTVATDPVPVTLTTPFVTSTTTVPTAVDAGLRGRTRGRASHGAPQGAPWVGALFAGLLVAVAGGARRFRQRGVRVHA